MIKIPYSLMCKKKYLKTRINEMSNDIRIMDESDKRSFEMLGLGIDSKRSKRRLFLANHKAWLESRLNNLRN